jgi:MEDS: MEthanogen/methylotroph, DcmR Sensory domain
MTMLNNRASSRHSWHSVNLFDDTESLSDAVAAFVQEGVSKRDHVLVVMRPEFWNRTAAKLDREHVSILDAITSGRLTCLDSRRTLQQFMRDGYPDRSLFDDIVGATVRRLTSEHGSVRVYGDMVDILAAEGEFVAAQRLEQLWNELGERQQFKLLCGYAAVNFAGPTAGKALRHICDLHDDAHASSDDALSTYLLNLAETDPFVANSPN